MASLVLVEYGIRNTRDSEGSDCSPGLHTASKHSTVRTISSFSEHLRVGGGDETESLAHCPKLVGFRVQGVDEGGLLSDAHGVPDLI